MIECQEPPHYEVRATVAPVPVLVGGEAGLALFPHSGGPWAIATLMCDALEDRTVRNCELVDISPAREDWGRLAIERAHADGRTPTWLEPGWRYRVSMSFNVPVARDQGRRGSAAAGVEG